MTYIGKARTKEHKFHETQRQEVGGGGRSRAYWRWELEKEMPAMESQGDDLGDLSTTDGETILGIQARLAILMRDEAKQSKDSDPHDPYKISNPLGSRFFLIPIFKFSTLSSISSPFKHYPISCLLYDFALRHAIRLCMKTKNKEMKS